jgi:hypothetical protein
MVKIDMDWDCKKCAMQESKKKYVLTIKNKKIVVSACKDCIKMIKQRL